MPLLRITETINLRLEVELNPRTMVDLNNSRNSEPSLILVDDQSGILTYLLIISCPLVTIIFIFLLFELLAAVK
jgi:hypothetical protein